MNYSFLRILNDIKTALLIKKLTITVKYSKQNFLFLRYLQTQGFISSIVKKGKIVIITRNKSTAKLFLNSANTKSAA